MFIVSSVSSDDGCVMNGSAKAVSTYSSWIFISNHFARYTILATQEFIEVRLLFVVIPPNGVIEEASARCSSSTAATIGNSVWYIR